MLLRGVRALSLTLTALLPKHNPKSLYMRSGSMVLLKRRTGHPELEIGSEAFPGSSCVTFKNLEVFPQDFLTLALQFKLLT